MTSEMAFECLLVSRDTNVVGIMSRLLRNLSISTEVCLSSSKAFDQLAGTSTDLIIVDWEDDAVDLLHKTQKSGLWHKPTVVVVCSHDFPIPAAHILLRKPVTEVSGIMCLKAAYSKMLCDYRRHARYALMSSVQATGASNRSVNVTVTDIGDGGIGISSKEEFSIGDVLCFRLLLPGAERPIYLEARVQWARNYGAAGCEYIRIPPVDLNILHDWLKNKTQVKKPVSNI